MPVVQTYHALGTVKRRHQGAQDTSPAGRIRDERALGQAVDRVVAQCQDEVRELMQLGVPARQLAVVPSGVNLTAFGPLGPAAAHRRDGPGCCRWAGWWSARASRTWSGRWPWCRRPSA